VLFGGFADAGGVDGLEAEGAGEVFCEGTVGAQAGGEFEGNGLAGLGGAGGGLGAGLAGHDVDLSLRPRGSLAQCRLSPSGVVDRNRVGGSGNP
jgi:hypothetical protein